MLVVVPPLPAHDNRPHSLWSQVLMIAVDDLRPEMAGPYGQAHMHTPNLQRLAQQGTTFNRAYCQVAVCAPSRTCALSFHFLRQRLSCL